MEPEDSVKDLDKTLTSVLTLSICQKISFILDKDWTSIQRFNQKQYDIVS